MSADGKPPSSEQRRPAVFSVDDPGLTAAAPEPAEKPGPGALGVGPPPRADNADAATRPQPSLRHVVSRGMRWGMVLASAASALAMLALGLWFVRFVSVAVARDDWIGWIASGLLALCGLAVVMMLLREIVGIIRVGRLGRVRHDAEAALRTPSSKAERAVVQGLRASLAGRGELQWHLARLAEHERDVHDPGALLRLAEREVVVPLDLEARRVVANSVKRVAMVTAISPTAIITVGTLAFETLRMLRRLAGIYGGRPGFVGTMRLARSALASIVAAGVVDFTTDFVGQFIGQDLMRRLSTRLGEGVFNGALTARIGAAAIDIVRPLPFIEVKPVRARDFVGDLWRMARGGADASTAGTPGQSISEGPVKR